jgi:hypothetical protein
VAAVTTPASPRDAVADEATILARVDEAIAIHPLPQPHRVTSHVDRAECLRDMSPKIQESARNLPPLLMIWCRTTRDMQAWAAHLECALQVRVCTYEDSICRTVEAMGSWLGWSVHLSSDEDTYRDVTPLPPLAIVRKAHLGVLL